MNKDSKIKLNSGNEMPVIALGTWQLNKDTAGVVAHAIEIGYRQIDTSSDYGSQPGVGEGIKRSGIKRSDIYVTTKVEENDDSYERTLSNLEELGLDYADLMLIHRPPNEGYGEELWNGLVKAKNESLTRDIGVSNYPRNLIEEIINNSGVVPAVNQIEWTPFGHSDKFREFLSSNNIIIQSYSPLTRGEKLNDDILVKIAGKYNKSPAQIILRWNLQSGFVPLPKANSQDHLKENIDVFDFEISEKDIEKLNNLNKGYSSLGVLPYIQ